MLKPRAMLRDCSIASGSYPPANVDRIVNMPTRTDAARRYPSIQGAISHPSCFV
jgi:hypothetical protein